MKFSLAAILLAGLAAAAPADVAVRSDETSLEKRLDPFTVTVAGAGAAAAIGAAARAAAGLIGNIANWNSAREAFTKATVGEMIKSANNEAAVCVNVGYSIDNPGLVRDLTDVDFKSGPLNTDYDCFYIRGPNKFYLRGDGGFINIAIQTGPCSYSNKVLACP